ncbi:hypothetical protein M0R45_035692 [Rubus argutus]|uniref:Uncharacterized protein n=1 Tax=Rubus argutus TaxID=59490 RepID=A0AAW1VXN0_RUBAR
MGTTSTAWRDGTGESTGSSRCSRGREEAAWRRDGFRPVRWWQVWLGVVDEDGQRARRCCAEVLGAYGCEDDVRLMLGAATMVRLDGAGLRARGRRGGSIELGLASGVRWDWV